MVAGTPLYWVDLLQLSFKHGSILNEGDINRRAGSGYAVTDNVRRVLDDPHFFRDLMRRARGDANQVFILPLICFVMNGRLYAHDHKRAAASLLGGARYMLAALNQDATLARLREVGYHPAKGLFSCADQGQLLYPTAADAWGHYFFRVGGEDPTALMRWVDTRGPASDPREGLDATDAAADPDFAALHRMCRPHLLASLDDADALRARYLELLTEGAHLIASLRARAGAPPDGRFRRALVQGRLIAHERVDALLAEGEAEVLALLAPYEAFFAEQRARVAGLGDRDALLRWALERVGNPFPAVVGAPFFSAALREKLMRALPVLGPYLDGGSDG